MPKSDLVRRTDQTQLARNGELVTATSVLQISQIALTGPFSGDFQIVDEGRLIVGQNPNLGARFIVTRDGIFGYNNGGMNTFAVYTQGNAQHTAGDIFAGGQNGNYLLYSQADGTLGLYTPAGAGFIARRDGSLQAGNADGAHMLWNSASRALEIRNGEDIKISLADTGDASFDGTIYASGGRIYGNMQIDAKLLVGDVDGPGVTIGKFERINDANELVESSEIMATDAENLAWFHVVAGGGTAQGGHFHLGAPGDYAGKLTFDGETLQVAGWTVNSTEFVDPSRLVRLDINRGIVFIGMLEESIATAQRDAASKQDVRQNMITFWETDTNQAWPTHRMLAYVNSDTTPADHILSIQAQPLYGSRATARLSAIGDKQAHVEIRAVGGYETANQNYTKIDLWSYRTEGTGFNYGRIDLSADAVYIPQRTSSTAFTGSLPEGVIMHTDGTYDPGGAGEGIYVYMNAVWKPIALGAYGWEAKTANFTAANVQYYPVTTGASTITATLPDALTKPSNWEYTFKKIDSGAGTVVVTAQATKLIDASNTYTLSTQWQFVTVRRYGSNWHIVAKG